jgi:hypothetical protein
MNSRRRWVGLLALVGAFLLVAGGRGRAVVEAQGDPELRRGDFVQAGRFTINKTRIDYVERGERGQLYVFFTSKNSIIVNGDGARALLQALGSDDAARPQ